MGFFSKDKCCVCGKEGRFMDSFDSGVGKKTLCNNCEQTMNVSGFIQASAHFGNNITYEDIQNYQKFYWQITNHLKSKATNNICVCSNLTDIVIDNDIICIPEYQNLIIKTNDVFAIAFIDLPKYSGLTTDAFMISFFTTNPALPYYSMIVAGKANFFSVNGKAKKFREATIELFNTYCTTLRYPIGKAKEIRKLIKKDHSFSLSVDKKKIMDWLDNADLGMGDFNPKNIERKIPSANWATQLFINSGINIV